MGSGTRCRDRGLVPFNPDNLGNGWSKGMREESRSAERVYEDRAHDFGSDFPEQQRRNFVVGLDKGRNLVVSAQALVLSVAHSLASDLHQKPIYLLRCDRAKIDIENVPAVLGKESDCLSIGVNRDPIPETKWLGAWDHGQDFGFAQTSDPSHGLFNLILLDRELVGIGDVLIVATAACPEVPAGRMTSVDRRLPHLRRIGPVRAAAFLCQLDVDALAVDRKGHEHYFPVNPADPGSTKGDFVYQDGDGLSRDGLDRRVPHLKQINS
jgi:hypothetical protein